MANSEVPVKGTQGLSYSGLNRSEQPNFTLNGFDVYIKVYKVGTGYADSVDFQTDLKQVFTGKIILSPTADAAAYTCTPKSGGIIHVNDLDELSANDVFILVAIGSRT
jgi:hypothetical protein